MRIAPGAILFGYNSLSGKPLFVDRDVDTRYYDNTDFLLFSTQFFPYRVDGRRYHVVGVLPRSTEMWVEVAVRELPPK